jgi:hypothetical protein
MVSEMAKKPRMTRKTATNFSQISVATVRQRVRSEPRVKPLALVPRNMIVEPNSSKTEPRSLDFVSFRWHLD